MSSAGHLSELESLRSQVADLTRALTERDQSMQAQSHHLEETMQDLREQSHLLLTITEGTAAEAGEEFFAALVTHLTRSLNVQYAIVGEVVGEQTKTVRTLAVSSGGQLVDNFEYGLVHTPCETALERTFACYERGVQDQFPRFTRLAELGVEGYSGIPLRTKAGLVNGLLVVMDTKPLRNTERLKSLMAVFASRAGAELQRQQAEAARRESEARLRFTQFAVDHAEDGILWADDSKRFIYANEAACRLLGYANEELLALSISDIAPYHAPTRFQQRLDQIKQGAAAIYESIHRRKDGTEFPIEASVTYLEHEGRGYSCGIVRDITERKRTEHERMQALYELQNIMETVPDIMFTLDAQGNMVKWNRRVEDVTGYSQEELLNKPALSFVPPEEQPRTAAAIQRAFTEGYAELEGHLLTKEQRLIPYHWTGALLTSPQGEPIGITGIGRDVSDKKRVEEALRESEQRLALAVEGSTDILWDAHRLPGEPWYAPQTPIWWSPRVRELLSLEESESFETLDQWAMRLHPDDKDRVFGQLAAHIEHRVPYDAEYRLCNNRGDYLWIRGRGQAMWDEQGEIRRMSGSCQDITERKRTEEALQMQASVLRRMLEGVSLSDANGVILYTNPAEDAMFGYEPGELIGKHVTVLNTYPPEENSRIVEGVIEQLKAKGSWEGEFSNRRKDGRPFTSFAHITALELSGKKHWVCVQADITERKRAEEAIREAELRYRTIFEQAGAGVAQIESRTGQFVQVNRQYCEIVGLTETEMLATTVGAVTHPDDVERNFESRARLLSGEIRSFTMEKRYVRKDGSIVWVNLNVAPLWRPGEMPVHHIAIVQDITERKRAEDALRRSERQLRTVLDALPVGVWFTDPSGKPVLANPAAKQIWSGIKQIRIGNAPNTPGWWEAIGPSDELHRWALSHALTKGVPSLNEILDFECLDGTMKTIRNTTVPVQDEAGIVLGAIVLNEDITVLRQAQEALKLTQFSVDHAVEGFFWISSDARVMRVNEAACRILEYTRDELTTMTVHSIDPNFSPEAWPIHWAELKEKVSLTFETKYWSKTGRVLDTEVTVNYLQYEGNEYSCAIMRDIGERKRVQAALRASEERYRSLYDETPTMYFTLATDGTVLSVNRFGAEQLGYQVEELTGHSVLGLFHEDDKETVAASLSECLATPEIARHWEFRKLRKDGSMMWVRETARVDQSSAEEPVVLVTCEDITEHKRTEHKSRERVWQAAAMQAALLELAHLDDTRLTFAKALPQVTRIVADMLAVERVSLWLLSEDQTELVCQDLYLRGQATHSAGSRLAASRYPRYCAVLKESLVVAASDARVDQRTSEFADGYFSSLGITSVLDVPICRQGKLVGVLWCEHVGAPREWAHEAQDFVASVGQTIVRMMETAERTQAEEDFRENHALLSAIMDTATDFIYVKDLAGCYLLANSALAQFMGKSVEEVIGQDDHALLPSELAASCVKADQQVIATGMTVTLEDNGIVGGKTIAYLTTKAPYLDRDGQIIGLIGMSRDISERKRAEGELRKSHSFIRQIIDTDPNFIFAKDREGRFTLVNQAVADAYGSTVEELVGKTDADFNIDPDEVEFFRKKDLEVMDSLQERFIPEEAITDSTGQTRWLQIVKRPILDEQGRASMVLGAATDITDRKRMEEALRQRERDLRTAVEERERISQDLHDGILQSLFAVGLTLEATKSMMSSRNRKTSGPPLDQAIDQLNRVMYEVRNFIAGLGSDLLQGKDLPTALQQMLKTLTQNQPMRVRLAVEDRAAQAVSAKQALHLFLVIQEAVSNCIRHGRAQEATVSLKMLKQGVRLSIRDNGRGFNQKATKGTGHGLTNMAARAQKIGGRFTVLSKVNEGTRIVLDLPKEASVVHR